MTHYPPPRRGWSAWLRLPAPILGLLGAALLVHVGLLIVGLCGVGR